MGSISIGICIIVIGLVGFFTYRTFLQKKGEVIEDHTEKMNAICQSKTPVTPELGEAELYIAMFTLFAEKHVEVTGRKISSNRLSPLEATFREGYQQLLGRGLPAMDKPFQKIKVALKDKDLMVQTS